MGSGKWEGESGKWEVEVEGSAAALLLLEFKLALVFLSRGWGPIKRTRDRVGIL